MTPPLPTAEPTPAGNENLPPSHVSSPRRRRRRGSRHNPGGALFSALGSSIQLLRWLLIGLIGLYLTSGFTRVGPQEDAVVYRLGKLEPTLHTPGFLFALPAPFDRVVRIPTRTQHELLLTAWRSEDPASSSPAVAMSAPAATAAPRGQPYFAPGGLDAISSTSMAVLAMGGASPGSPLSGRGGLHPVRDGYTLTADVNLVQGGLSIRYRIVDPFAWVKAGTSQTINALIEGSCYHAATSALAVTKIDDALGARLSSLREEVRTAAQARIDALALGVELVAVEVQQWVPPAAVLGAFNEVTSAQVEARTAVEQARTYRAQLLPKAESDAYRLRQQAEADRTQWVARAQGETSAFLALLAEHQAAPALVEPRLRAEALEEVLPRLKFKTILPAETGPLHLLLREGR